MANTDITKKEIRISVGDADGDRNPDEIVIEIYENGSFSGTVVATDKDEDGIVDENDIMAFGADADGDGDTDKADKAVWKGLAEAFLKLEW